MMEKPAQDPSGSPDQGPGSGAESNAGTSTGSGVRALSKLRDFLDPGYDARGFQIKRRMHETASGSIVVRMLVLNLFAAVLFWLLWNPDLPRTVFWVHTLAVPALDLLVILGPRWRPVAVAGAPWRLMELEFYAVARNAVMGVIAALYCYLPGDADRQVTLVVICIAINIVADSFDGQRGIVRMLTLAGYYVPIGLRIAFDGGGGDIPLLVALAAGFAYSAATSFHQGRSEAAGIDMMMRNEELARELAARNAELEQSNQALAQARREAEQASRSKTRFLAGASHDLRQPMQAVSLFLGLLRKERLGARSRELVDKVDRSLAAVSGLLDTLLDVSRFDAGVVSAERRAFPIGPLLREAAEEFSIQASEKGLSFRVVDSALWVESDLNLVRLCVWNFCANAVRYTAAGGIVVGVRRQAGLARLVVADTGPGIPESEQARVFEEFYQVEARPRGGQKGLGLGLSIVQRIGAMLGHEIGLASIPGRGTAFWIALPRVAAEREVRATTLEIDTELGGYGAMIVEDDPVVREGLFQTLQQWGMLVVAAPGFEEAVALCDDIDPDDIDMVITDLRLPGDRDGLEAARVVSARLGRDLPVVVVSGDADIPERRGMAGGDRRVLSKPVTAEELRATIAALVDGG